MEFKGFIKTSVIEYPGKIVSLVFVGGCNFRCPFCQNPDLVLNPRSLPSTGEKEVIDHLLSRRKWLDGLVITGGEPMLEKDLPNFLSKIKKEGFLVEIETNGTNPGMLRDLVKRSLIDYLALDIKAPFEWEKYSKAAGIVDENLFGKVKESVKILSGSNIDYELRTTVVPGLVDQEDLISIARSFGSVKKYVLQQFVPKITLDKQYEKIKPYSKDKLEEMKEKIADCVEFCEIRGM
ncbi:anaerobic ribonucleoside-triphosphate reductase activating protein [Candidatus Aerophobetes bacterium Ae_b3b]|nr:MAG: anaerobic ribonucleoside-triphosphate reductase activating protein [Candidatus Aerophobetes bacterium Ae_b3b]